MMINQLIMIMQLICMLLGRALGGPWARTSCKLVMRPASQQRSSLCTAMSRLLSHPWALVCSCLCLPPHAQVSSFQFLSFYSSFAITRALTAPSSAQQCLAARISAGRQWPSNTSPTSKCSEICVKP